MTPDLLVDITAYKNYFLIISGAYGGRKLSIFDKQLNKISEHEFSGIQMWGENFHIDEESSKILISVTTTETFSLENKRYQGYNTLWYELTKSSKGFDLQLIDKWEKSDIKAIKSKVYKGERNWVALREINYISQAGNKGRNEIIGLAKTDNIDIPKFEYSASVQHSYLSQNIDFEVTDDNIYISGIGSTSADVPTIIRIERNRKNMENLELDIPLKKLHNFHDTVIKNVNNEIFAYFWTTSSENCKKYVFEIYCVKICDSLRQSTFAKAIDSEYAHSFAWNKNMVAFKTNKGSTPCRLGKIDGSGKIIQIEELESSHPVLLTDSEELMALSDDRKHLKRIK